MTRRSPLVMAAGWMAWAAACQKPEGAEINQTGSGTAPSPAPAFTIPQQQAARPDTASVALSFHEFTAPDATRAAVARVIVEGVSAERWQTLAVAESLQSRDAVILSHYQYNRGEFPQTVSVLVAAIDTANRSG